MTVVFADLVGSTARAERLDRRTCGRSWRRTTRLRHELERHGRTVEKFIGDAVVGVFGAPVAHEDDPERRRRAALAIQEAIAELNEAEPALELEYGSASTPARPSWRWRRGPRRARAWCRAMSSTPRRGSSRGSGEQDPRRRADASGDRASDRLRRARRAGEGRRSRSQRGWRCVATPAAAGLGDAGQAAGREREVARFCRCAGRVHGDETRS